MHATYNNWYDEWFEQNSDWESQQEVGGMFHTYCNFHGGKFRDGVYPKKEEPKC